MIKTKELMLGNWVLAGKNAKFPMQVASIFEDEVYLNFGGERRRLLRGKGRRYVSYAANRRNFAEEWIYKEEIAWLHISFLLRILHWRYNDKDNSTI